MKGDFKRSGIHGYEDEYLGLLDRQYLEKFWLDKDELIKSWSDVLENSFLIRDEGISISSENEVDVRIGGILFDENEFNEFKELALQSGADSFVLIEDIGQKSWSRIVDIDFLRFSYPLGISWCEMACSCEIASDIFSRPIRAFFVVANNGAIGKYSNSDSPVPYELYFQKK